MKIALALCGGGSLGSYEVGAIEKLYEKGLSFDIVTGSSVGALNGFFVATHDFKKLISFWENIEMSNIIKDGFNETVERALNRSDGFIEAEKARCGEIRGSLYLLSFDEGKPQTR